MKVTFEKIIVGLGASLICASATAAAELHPIVEVESDLEADAVSVRLHGKGNLVTISRNEATVDLLAEIEKRRA